MKLIKLLVITFLTIIYIDVIAHHSAAIYNRQEKVTIEGTIVRYQWSNPHVYLWLEEVNPDGRKVTWEIEGLPPSALKRMGWSKETVSTGDKVVVTGNPGRKQNSKVMLMGTLDRADETLLNMANLMSALSEDIRPVTKQASGLEGTWYTLLNMVAMRNFFDASVLKLTEKGRNAVDTYVEEVDNPGIDCVPGTPPGLMLSPDIKIIEVHDDVVIIRGEFENIERRVYLDKGSHEGAKASLHGHSIGHWEEGALIIDTTHFTPQRTGNGRLTGLPSSPRKHLLERLELNEEKSHLLYSFKLEDPEYLTDPMIVEGVQWSYRPDLEFEELTCDLDNARLFTN